LTFSTMERKEKRTLKLGMGKKKRGSATIKAGKQTKSPMGRETHSSIPAFDGKRKKEKTV